MSATSTVSVARVPTASASRYIQQLAKHWSHRMEVHFTEQEGTIAFPSGTHLQMRADSDNLELILSVPPGEDTDHMRKVVEEHIDRFAFREGPLTYDWNGPSVREG